MQRDRRVEEILELDVAAEQPAQTMVWHQVVTSSTYTAHKRGGPDREDVPALKLAPDPAEPARGRWHLRARGHERGVERPGRGSDQKVRRDPLLVQGLKHPHLHRRQARAARENERRARARSASFREAPRLMQRGSVHRFTTLRVGSSSTPTGARVRDPCPQGRQRGS
jgi:hypothetical protein